MAAAARVLVLATALAAPAAAQDVLIARDGTSRSGALKSCVGEICVFGSGRVSRAEIAWLGLGPGRETARAKPPAATQTAVDEVHLGTGRVVVSPVTGISLGVVATAAGSYDRPEVAWIRFAGGAAGAAPTDLILRRAGGIERGELQGCAADRCTLSGKSFTRDESAWIGLQVTDEAPPPIEDRSRDEIHRADGGIDPGPLVGIGAQNVVTQRATYARAQVAWIYLALPATEDQPGQETETESEDKTQDEVREPPEPPEPPTPKEPTPPTPPGDGRGQRGALWIGTLDGVCAGTSGDFYLEWSYHVDVRMREYRHTPPCFSAGAPGGAGGAARKPKTWIFIELEPEGSVVHNRLQGRFLSPPQMTCDGGGSVTISAQPGEADISHPNAIYLNPNGCDMRASAGWEVARGRGLYSASVPTRLDDRFTWSCSGGVPQESGFISPSFGGHSMGGLGMQCSDPEVRYLEANNGRMSGSYTTSCTDGCTMHVAFSICREGVKCPPPDALPGEESPKKDPCDPGTQADLRDNCYKQLELRRTQLEPHIDDYNKLQKEASDLAPSFERADLECEIWETVETLLLAFIGGGAGKMGEAGKALIYLADVLNKVEAGELHTLLYPEWAEEYLEHYQQVKDAYASVTDDEFTKMQKRLESCSGKVSVDTQIAAEKFLGLLQAAKQVWQSKVAPGLNDLRSKGLECAGWDHQAWKACMDYAECRGVPPACGPEPSLDIK